MSTTSHADSADRLVRIELMIECYRVATAHRLDQRARILWRKVETQQMFLELEKPVERVH